MKYYVQYYVFLATFHVILQKVDYLWDSVYREYVFSNFRRHRLQGSICSSFRRQQITGTNILPTPHQPTPQEFSHCCVPCTYTLYTVYAYKNVKSRCWGAFDHPFNACACAATPFYMAPIAACITATLFRKIWRGIQKPKYANFTGKSVIYAFQFQRQNLLTVYKQVRNLHIQGRGDNKS